MNKLLKICFLLLWSMPLTSSALVVCAPTSCKCDCDYYTCTKEKTATYEIDEVPFTISSTTPPSVDGEACAFSGETIEEVPFKIKGKTYDKIKSNVEIKYKVCERKRAGACPKKK